jgi:hypothetical protein
MLNLSGRNAWSEEEVRRLLRGLRRPHALRNSPLARALMVAYDVDEPVRAARQFVAESFAAGGLVGRRLAEIVFQSDFDASAPLVVVARRMGLSARQFFRLRAEAVSVLAQQAEMVASKPAPPERAIKVLAESLAGTDPETAAAIVRITAPNQNEQLPADPCERLLALCGFARTCFGYGNLTGARRITEYVRREVFDRQFSQRAAVEFEMAWLTYLDAVYSQSVVQSCERADDLFRIPEVSLDQATRRYIARAESRLRLGDWASSGNDVLAVETLTAAHDVRGRAVIVAANGAAAFLKHDFHVADDCYAAVLLALPRRPVDRWICESMLVRVRRQLRRPAHSSSLQELGSLSGGFVTLDRDDVVVLPGSPEMALGHLMLEISTLRHGLAGAREADALLPAMHAVLEKALSSRYAPVEAMSYAALADAHSRSRNWSQAEYFAALAWSAWSRTEDRTVAVDLFAACPQELAAIVAGSTDIAGRVRAWINERYPQHPFATWSAAKLEGALTALRAHDADTIPTAQDEKPNYYRDPVMAALAMLVEPAHRSKVVEVALAALPGRPGRWLRNSANKTRRSPARTKCVDLS